MDTSNSKRRYDTYDMTFDDYRLIVNSRMEWLGTKGRLYFSHPLMYKAFDLKLTPDDAVSYLFCQDSSNRYITRQEILDKYEPLRY